MTNTVPLTELPGPVDDKRRDQWGRLLVVPPGGGKPTGYTRVTTVAKTLDSGGGLAPWKASMTACGVIMRPGLRSRWEALLALYGDPWYGSDLGKAECKKLVEECAAVGGANDRKEIGSSLHTLTALVDLGRTPDHLTTETQADVTAYVGGLAAAGVSIVPGFIEVTVVLDSCQVAGTFDRLVTIPGFELPIIADLKTGADLSYSWQAFAVQLAAYSRGEAIYRQGKTKDGSADERLPMPEVDQRYGLIMWLNAGTGTLELYLVDLEAGWGAFDHSMWTRGWRNQSVILSLADAAAAASLAATGQVFPKDDTDLTAALEASLAAQQAKGETEADSRLSPKPASEPIGPITPEKHTAFLRGWLQDRINTIGAKPEARQMLGQDWPKTIPTLRASDAHTPEQLTDIERLLDAVEKRWEIAFPPPRPGEPEATAKVLSMFPGSTMQNHPTDKEPA